MSIDKRQLTLVCLDRLRARDVFLASGPFSFALLSWRDFTAFVIYTHRSVSLTSASTKF